MGERGVKNVRIYKEGVFECVNVRNGKGEVFECVDLTVMIIRSMVPKQRGAGWVGSAPAETITQSKPQPSKDCQPNQQWSSTFKQLLMLNM